MVMATFRFYEELNDSRKRGARCCANRSRSSGCGTDSSRPGATSLTAPIPFNELSAIGHAACRSGGPVRLDECQCFLIRAQHHIDMVLDGRLLR